MKPPRSLKGRALQWLAQREQSRNELRRKLMPYAVAEIKAQGAASVGEPETGAPETNTEVSAGPDRAEARSSAAARVEAVLDWLEAHHYLSQERFAEARVHARAPRFGNLRIRQELKQHQVALSPEAAQALRDSELQRACAVLDRKFGQLPTNAVERARQARFLAGRGFSPEAISKALRRDGAEQHATFEG